MKFKIRSYLKNTSWSTTDKIDEVKVKYEEHNNVKKVNSSNTSVAATTKPEIASYLRFVSFSKPICIGATINDHLNKNISTAKSSQQWAHSQSKCTYVDNFYPL